MTRWKDNKAKAVTYPDPVSLTDQSQAKETDINVIVAKMGITGTVPGSPQEPMYGDWTHLPTDLRGYIETARELETLRAQLPEQLKTRSVEDIIAMKPETLAELLKPANPPDSTETKTNG